MDFLELMLSTVGSNSYPCYSFPWWNCRRCMVKQRTIFAPAIDSNDVDPLAEIDTLKRELDIIEVMVK